jgi:hypothetical protein
VGELDGVWQYAVCVRGLSECSDDMPCSMHNGWKTLRACIIDYLERNTIGRPDEGTQSEAQSLVKRSRPKK